MTLLKKHGVETNSIQQRFAIQVNVLAKPCLIASNPPTPQKTLRHAKVLFECKMLCSALLSDPLPTYRPHSVC